MKDKTLIITENTISKLNVMKSKSKFILDDKLFYPGAPSTKVKKEAEGLINDLLTILIDQVPSNPKKSYVMREFKNTLKKFNEFDSEEQDRVCNYLEEIMDMLRISNSDGLLNKWRYGFDPKQEA